MGISAIFENGDVESLTTREDTEYKASVIERVDNWIYQANELATRKHNKIVALEASIRTKSISKDAETLLIQRLGVKVRHDAAGSIVEFSGTPQTVYSYILAIVATVDIGQNGTDFEKERTKSHEKQRAQSTIKTLRVYQDCPLVMKLAEMNGTNDTTQVVRTLNNWNRTEVLEILKVAYEQLFNEPYGRPKEPKNKLWDEPVNMQATMQMLNPEEVVGEWNFDQ